MRSGCAIEIPGYGDLNQYIACLRNRPSAALLCGNIHPGAEMQRSLERLIRGGRFVLLRKRDVRRIVSFFQEECIHVPVKLRFPLALRERAYMTDWGEMAISRCFLYGAGGGRVLKVLIHEIAHWWLAVQEPYRQLLGLDCEFRNSPRAARWPVLLSPVEMLATRLECEILLSLADSFHGGIRELLLSLGNQEQNRISTAIASLCL